MAIEVQTTPTVCVRDATTGCGGSKPTAGVPPTFVHPNNATCTAQRYLAIEVQTTPTVCVHDATTGC